MEVNNNADRPVATRISSFEGRRCECNQHASNFQTHFYIFQSKISSIVQDFVMNDATPTLAQGACALEIATWIDRIAYSKVRNAINWQHQWFTIEICAVWIAMAVSEIVDSTGTIYFWPKMSSASSSFFSKSNGRNSRIPPMLVKLKEKSTIWAHTRELKLMLRAAVVVGATRRAETHDFHCFGISSRSPRKRTFAH